MMSGSKMCIKAVT